jgi:hypothetical protein
LKQHKPQIDEKCSKLLEQRKQAKLQWLQNPNLTNGDYVNNVSHDTGRNFGNRKTEYLKEKLVSFKQTVRTKISETYIEAQMNLRSVTKLELYKI